MFCTIKPTCDLFKVRYNACIQKTDPPKEIRYSDHGQHSFAERIFIGICLEHIVKLFTARLGGAQCLMQIQMMVRRIKNTSGNVGTVVGGTFEIGQKV